MIKTEAEYQEAQQRILAEKERLENERRRLAGEGLTSEEIANLVEPFLCFHQQLIEEVEAYERLKRGDFGAIRNLASLGRLLIQLRIFRGLSQRELADRLGVSEAQVSRDERNEYHNIGVNRADKILQILDVTLISQVDESSLIEEVVTNPCGHVARTCQT